MSTLCVASATFAGSSLYISSMKYAQREMAQLNTTKRRLVIPDGITHARHLYT